ncbi:MAG: sugar ABC transporter ATP-binding protein [Anaerolineales bacterium]|jgi:ribose transport system ATP-binding protein
MTQDEKTNNSPLMEVRNIDKSFPGVKALDNVSVKFFPGEVHAVVGENGAGKSTLMKIMVGAYTPDRGAITFQGKKVSFAHPVDAQHMGISIIYQEFNLLPERTVAQNIFLGREPSLFGVVNMRQLNKQAKAVLEEIGVETMISPTAMTSSLSVAEQQLVEIAKAISLDSKVLIMDEPTASLTSTEVQLLSELISRLKEKGLAIIFISHRLAEVFEVAEKITVLKDGQFVDTVNTKEVTPEDIVYMMVGRVLDHYFPPLGSAEDFGDVVLQVEDGSNDFLNGVNLELRRGEILGIAGLQGSGRTELAQAMFGAVPFKTGTIRLRGEIVTIKNPLGAIRQGMGFVTEDRKSEGLTLMQPIRDNMLMTVRTLQPLLGLIFRDGIKRSSNLVPTLGEQVDIRVDSYDKEVQDLSGGNQQKVVLSKWLASKAEIFIFDEPTRGIDVEAKASIHDMIRELTKQGVAVMMISSELPEIIGMSDRILVMRDGTIGGELPPESSEADIILVATGHDNNQKPTMLDEPKEEVI